MLTGQSSRASSPKPVPLPRARRFPKTVETFPSGVMRRIRSFDLSVTKTVPVGVITELVEGDVYHWGSLMAGALLGSIPVAVLYSFFVDHYVSGMTGAVKE